MIDTNISLSQSIDVYIDRIRHIVIFVIFFFSIKKLEHIPITLYLNVDSH